MNVSSSELKDFEDKTSCAQHKQQQGDKTPCCSFSIFEPSKNRKYRDSDGVLKVPFFLRTDFVKFYKIINNTKFPLEKGYKEDKVYNYEKIKSDGWVGNLGLKIPFGMFVIDFDSKDLFQYVYKRNYFSEKDFIVETKNGFHVYCFDTRGDLFSYFDKDSDCKTKKITFTSKVNGECFLEIIRDCIVLAGSMVDGHVYQYSNKAVPCVMDKPKLSELFKIIFEVMPDLTTTTKIPKKSENLPNSERKKYPFMISDVLRHIGIPCHKPKGEETLYTSTPFASSDNGSCFAYNDCKGVFMCHKTHKKGTIRQLLADLRHYCDIDVENALNEKFGGSENA